MAKVILNIGHGGIKHDPGACANGFKEHFWNKEFVEEHLVPILKERGVEYEIVIQDTFPTLASKINRLTKKGDFILSFHLNSADPEAHGTEMLYYVKSSNSKKLAEIFQKAAVETLVLRDREIKPKTLADRGGSLLVKTNCPCIILETGFVSNVHDMEVLEAKKNELAVAYADAIQEYFKVL